jgi:Zn-dependent protease
LLSTTFHEAAHAYVAKLGGDPTAFHGGQVTLNPIPHMRREPIGTIFAPIVSYLVGGWMIGWASAPYDPDWQRRYPHRAAWMALAGPVANLTLTVFAGVLIRVGVARGLFRAPAKASFTHIVEATGAATAALAPPQAELAATCLSILLMLNLLLFAFNLLPIPPLDGHSAITLFMSKETAVRFSELTRSPMLGYIGLLVAWQVFGSVFNPVFTLALSALYPGSVYR